VASRIQGITVEIGGDTTKLSTALSKVNKEIKSTQTQLKDVEKLLKMDPGNAELIAQKHKLLQQAVAETKEKLEGLKEAQKQADEALKNGTISQEQYDGLQREIIETEQDLKKLEAAAKESATAMDGIVQKGESLKSTGDKVAGVGEKFLPVTAGVAALGTAAVKTAADFDSSMSKVAAVSGATGKDFDDLKAKAREMGSKTKFSASEAAEAMNYMAMAGWKTEDMLSGIDGVMNLAAASGEDLATTSDIVTDALTAFGLSAQDSGHFADILAAASSNANTNVSMMGETFKYAAPIAGALGFSAEDTAEAIGLMANAGIKSSQAGTSLRTIMNNLTGDVKFTGAAFGEMEIATTNADGSMRDLSDILADCRGAFSQMSESEKAANAEALVGKNAMSGFLAIMNAGEGDVSKLSNAIANCDGTAEKMAGTMQDNLEGQLTILKSQLEELAISFGELLMPAVRAIVSGIQKFVDVLNKLPTGVKTVITVIALLAAAIGPVLIVVGKTMSAVGTIMTYAPKIASMISTIGTGMKALWGILAANPIILIVAAIAALVAGFIYLWNTSDSFRQFWIDLWEGIKSVVSTAVEAVKGFLSGVVDFISNNWQTILAFIVNPFAGAFKLLYDNCEGFREFIDGFLNGVKELFTTIWGGIVEVVSGVWESITTTIGTFMQTIFETITGIWQGIVETVTPLLEAFRYLFETIFQAIQILIGMALDWIKTKVETIWNGIVTFLTPLLEGIKTFIETIWNAISTFFSTVLNSIKTVFTTVWNAIKTAITTVVNAIKTVVTTVWNNIKTVITTVMNTIKSTVTSIWNNVKTAVGNIIGQIYNTIHSGFERAVGYVKGLASQAFNWGKDLIMGIVNGIKSCISAVTDAVTSVANKIKELLHFSRPDKGPLHEYEKWMPDFMDGLAHGINTSKSKVSAAMHGLAEDMVISPTMDTSQLAGANGMTIPAGGSSVDLVGQIREAMQGMSPQGDIVIPVYIGNHRIEDIVVDATQRMNYRSGGR